MGHIKDFDGRNKDKKNIDQRRGLSFPKEREVWNISLGINIGSEADGKRGYYRPILVIKKIGSMYLCIPMTTKGKINSPYYFKIDSVTFVNNLGKPIESYLMLSHIKSLDIKRFYKHKGTINKEEFNQIQKTLQKLFFAVF